MLESLYYREPPATDARVVLRFLGTAGFVIEGEDRTLVLDPYITRPGLGTLLLRRLQPDTALIKEIIPKADDVLVGHAHMDHILDAPPLCAHTGARFIGSKSAAIIARAFGLPEAQILETEGRQNIACGSVSVRGLPSRHGKVVLNRIPLPGEVAADFRWPARTWDFRCGQVLNWHLQVGNRSVVHIDSADYIDSELEGLKADVLCLCAVGRKYRPNYTRDIIQRLEPKYVIPCHWDSLVRPWKKAAKVLPLVDLPGFIDEIRDLGAKPILLPFNGRFGLS